MASGSAPLAAQRRRRVPTTVRPQTHRGHISKATTLRRSARIAKKSPAEERPRSQAHSEQNVANPQPVQKRAVKVNSSQQRRRSLRLQTANPTQTQSMSARRLKAPTRPREEAEAPSSYASSNPSRPFANALSMARIEYWTKNGTWPTVEQEKTLDRVRARFSPGLDMETAQTRSNQQPQDQKSAPYSHAQFETELERCNSFMEESEEGISAQSERLCEMLMKTPQSSPEHTLFSDDNLYKKTCKRLVNENETKVIRDIAQLIVPSAEVLADRGVEHLNIVRETTNATWLNAIPYLRAPDCRPGPRPQPDFGVGFKEEAFNQERLEKLRPYIGNTRTDSSLFAATYNMYFPFLTSEVKGANIALGIADRQNAHTQSGILRGLTELFTLTGQQDKLHREISSFSISHDQREIRIYGHYATVNGKEVKFYRHPITEYILTSSTQAVPRWQAYTVVRNIYDLWLPGHFKRICSAIDEIPAGLDFQLSELSQSAHARPRAGPGSLRSGPVSLRSGPGSSHPRRASLRSARASSGSELPALVEDSYYLSDAADPTARSESSNSKKKKKRKRKKKM